MSRVTRSVASVAAVVLSVFLLTACGTPGTEQPGEFTLSSPDLDAQGHLPEWASNTVGGTCEGENRSPELRWVGEPAGTESFMLTLTDPAHPGYVHWVVTGIPGDVDGVPGAADGAIGVGVTGESWQGTARYSGLCLPDNPYVYTVYALDEVLVGERTDDLEDALELVDGHVLATAELSVLRAPDPEEP